MSEFDGLVAAVTGGASGIGAATVRVLRERGAKVAALDLDAAAEGDLAVVDSTWPTTRRSGPRSTG